MLDKTLLLGHSPDADDAFMFAALAEGKIDTHGRHFEHILQDIQTLNDRARRGELHVTALSIHAYPFVADKYALMACGASMGDGYGPLVVATRPGRVEDLIGRTIAIPGETTSAYLALNLLLGRGKFRHVVVPFDQIIAHVAAGSADAGLVIHEGQLTYSRQRLYKIVDLGEWWTSETGLPLPLGGNGIRRDLGAAAMAEITQIVQASIRHALEHRAEAVQHALRYARDLDPALADRFIGMYVNDWTLDYGAAGRRAIELFLKRGADIGLVPPLTSLDFVG